ncbi:AraC family transcriptional regulator [Chitinophaga sedimenti]|uniref:helix-turn-helix domain-containing protein n=1 Tax=Chitinophaga sedimenti TaxID=2033606 RepID=UPI00200397FB|nr:AraC family transcriptional regulator [Chitinophaga sedimenti]MCK7555040.1 AraC family transcriptional regulator [Chitinophaga sedimenti]
MLQFIDDLAKTKKSKKDTYQYDPTEVAAILESRDEILSRRYLGVPIPLMALDFNMPYRKFNRYYKKATNSNVRDDKKRDRVKAACKLLTTTDLSVGAIADELEYKSHASFTRTFCEVMGCTPTRYRQYHRRGGDA